MSRLRHLSELDLVSRRRWGGWIAATGITSLTLTFTISTVILVWSGRGMPAGLFVLTSVITVCVVLMLAVRFQLKGYRWRYAAVLCGALVASLLVPTVGFDLFGTTSPEILFGWFLLICWSSVWAWLGYLVVALVALLKVVTSDLYQADPSHHFVHIAFTVTVVLATGAVVRCLMLLARLGYELRNERNKVAWLQKVNERARMAQDLHDTLGQNIVAIDKLGELVERLLPPDADDVLVHVSRIRELARDAHGDIHRVAHADRRFDVEQELANAVARLEENDVHACVETGDAPVRQAPDVLGVVLREAVTNVIRHSDASRCRIRLSVVDDWWRLEIENDGVRSGVNDQAAGTGLRGFRDRLERVGGRVAAGRRAGGWFRIVAEVPAPLAAHPPHSSEPQGGRPPGPCTDGDSLCTEGETVRQYEKSSMSGEFPQ